MGSKDRLCVSEASLHARKARAQGAVEEKLRETVHQRPMEGYQRIAFDVTAEARTDSDNHGLQLGESSSRSLLGGGELSDLDELRAKHEAKVSRPAQGKGHVSEPLSQKALLKAGGPSMGGERRLEFPKSNLDKSREDRLAISEVMIGSLVAEAGSTRDLPHAERGEAFCLEQCDCGVENAGARVGLHDWHLWGIPDTVK